jgi:hypothetical protein
MRSFSDWLNDSATEWLTKDGLPPPTPLCDFKRLQYELRAGDVILIEGRSRVAEVIRVITQSPWSHAALYIGRLYDIQDRDLREVVEYHYDGDPEDHLIVEALMGKGTIISRLSTYQQDHVRICRPASLSPQDAQQVIAYTAKHLGWDYDLRQVLDLARFFFPWSILPRRWRSSLFQHNAGNPTRIVCSTLLAQAFGFVNYPILPFIDRADDGSVRFFKRNPKLFAPRDFDTSPYFEIIKYPYLGLADLGLYRKLPWAEEDIYYNDEAQAFAPDSPRPEPAATNDEGDKDPGEATEGGEPKQPARRFGGMSNFPFLRHKG